MGEIIYRERSGGANCPINKSAFIFHIKFFTSNYFVFPFFSTFSIIYFHMCVCVCVPSNYSLTNYIYIYICVCVCVFVCLQIIRLQIIYIYIYMCVCVCDLLANSLQVTIKQVVRAHLFAHS